MKTVACLSCKTSNIDPTPQSVCTNCGEPLAVALFQQSIDEISKVTARMQELTAPRKSFYSFNGFGTMLLDYRALPDGTYETTRWVIAMMLPIFPLATYVIRPTIEERGYGHHTTRFAVLSKRGLSAISVLRTYLLAFAGLAPLVLGFLNSDKINRAMSGPKAFGVMLLTVGWAFYIVFFKIPNVGKAYKKITVS